MIKAAVYIEIWRETIKTILTWFFASTYHQIQKLVDVKFPYSHRYIENMFRLHSAWIYLL